MESTSSLTFINPQPLFSFSNPIINGRFLHIQLNQSPPLHLRFASNRLTNFPHDGELLASASRNWSRNKGGAVIGDYYYNGGGGGGEEDDDDDDDGDEEEEDRSLDLLVKFVENVFKKVSKRARKAVRSVLPIPISTKLVGFSVNGVIILTFLWVLKAFLEVVCTLGSVVFTSILVIRGVWAGISYLQQESRLRRGDVFHDPVWSGTRPAT